MRSLAPPCGEELKALKALPRAWVTRFRAERGFEGENFNLDVVYVLDFYK